MGMQGTAFVAFIWQWRTNEVRAIKSLLIPKAFSPIRKGESNALNKVHGFLYQSNCNTVNRQLPEFSVLANFKSGLI